MTPAELAATLRAISDLIVDNRRGKLAAADAAACLRAADLIEQAYPAAAGEPPPGHVRVRVAMAWDGRNFAAYRTSHYAVDDRHAMEQAESELPGLAKNRCIAVVDLRPVPAIPEVPAAVEEVRHD